MKNRIKRIRDELGINQTKFAERISVSRSAVCKMESGENNPSDQTIKLICQEFNVNENWLRNGVEPIFIEVSKENQLMSWAANILKDESDSFKRRFVNMLMSLTEDEWEFIERKAKELAGIDDKKADG